MSYEKPKNKEAADIESRLKKVRRAGKRPRTIGPRLVGWMADWARYRNIQERWGSAGTDDWDVVFLQWALKGRVKQFVDHCEAQETSESKLALKGIKQVYDFVWPHTSTCGYIFAYLWGWLQLELEKPGETRPSTPLEQMKRIRKWAKESGTKINGWTSDGFGGVRAIVDSTLTNRKEA